MLHIAFQDYDCTGKFGLGIVIFEYCDNIQLELPFELRLKLPFENLKQEIIQLPC
ncbi:hypothetical protein D3C78_1985770 [compost metagenome]